MRNEGRKYLFYKKEHPRHFEDSYNAYNKATDHTDKHSFIEKRHTNFQGDACYGDAGMVCVVPCTLRKRDFEDLFPLAAL